MGKWIIPVLMALIVAGALVWARGGGCCAAEEASATQPAATPSSSDRPSGPTATLDIDGMDCTSCATAIRIALQKVDGVKDAKVSLDDARAVVTYDSSKVTVEKLTATVNKLGYKASIPAGDGAEASVKQSRKAVPAGAGCRLAGTGGGCS